MEIVSLAVTVHTHPLLRCPSVQHEREKRGGGGGERDGGRRVARRGREGERERERERESSYL